MNDQDQVDIGDDINERELRDDTFEVGDAGFDINERELRFRDLPNEPKPVMRDFVAELVALQPEPVNAPGDLDEPDAQALAGALFAQLGYVVADIGDAETMAVIVDGDLDTLALDLHKLDNALQQLGTIRDEIAQALAAQMDKDLEAIAGFAVQRTKNDKVEWDRAAALRHVRSAILDRWARSDGEIEPALGELVDRVLTDIQAVYTTLNPTVKGLQALAVNPYELRSTTPATRWTVTVTA